jgi:hypothetical protein
MTTNHLKPADTMLSTMEAHPAVPNIGLWASNLAYSLDLFRREAECGACSGLVMIAASAMAPASRCPTAIRPGRS